MTPFQFASTVVGVCLAIVASAHIVANAIHELKRAVSNLERAVRGITDQLQWSDQTSREVGIMSTGTIPVFWEASSVAPPDYGRKP